MSRRYRRRIRRGAIAAAALAALALLAAAGGGAANGDEGAPELRDPGAFADIEDVRERSAVLFTEASKVLLHPRCVNCHPAGDRPLAGDRGEPHQPPVERGAGGLGAVGMRCGSCHLDENFDPGRVPGAPHWRLAPIEMAWEGRGPAEICAQLKDRERNGGRSLEEMVEHMAHDELIAWGWHPDAGRSPAPGSQELLGDLIAAWVETGAVCPQTVAESGESGR